MCSRTCIACRPTCAEIITRLPLAVVLAHAFTLCTNANHAQIPTIIVVSTSRLNCPKRSSNVLLEPCVSLGQKKKLQSPNQFAYSKRTKLPRHPFSKCLQLDIGNGTAGWSEDIVQMSLGLLIGWIASDYTNYACLDSIMPSS